MYYLNSRYYDPTLGRFINADGIADTGLGTIGTNMYTYCNNNPINGIDDGGELPIIPIALGIVYMATTLWDVKTAVEEPSFENIGWAVAGVTPVGKAAKAGKVIKTAEKIKNSTKTIKASHGNSKASTKIQHGYEIYNKKTNDVAKTGISGQTLNKNGTSRRANSQVNLFNKKAGADIFGANVVKTNIPGRAAALEWEKRNVNLLREQGNRMIFHKFP